MRFGMSCIVLPACCGGRAERSPLFLLQASGPRTPWRGLPTLAKAMTTQRRWGDPVKAAGRQRLLAAAAAHVYLLLALTCTAAEVNRTFPPDMAAYEAAQRNHSAMVRARV